MMLLNQAMKAAVAHHQSSMGSTSNTRPCAHPTPFAAVDEGEIIDEVLSPLALQQAVDRMMEKRRQCGASEAPGSS